MQFADRIENVGKQVRDESGKHPVNEDDEEILHGVKREPVSCGTISEDFRRVPSERHTRKNENARDKPGHDDVIFVDSERLN